MSTPDDSRNPESWQTPPGSGQPPHPYGQPGYQAPGPKDHSGYGPQSPYDPYGQQGYQQQGPYGPPGQGYGMPPQQNADRPHTHAIVALVVSIVLALSCWVSPGGIAGAILSGIALGNVDNDPRKAKTLLKWCWISIGINVALLILGFAAFVVAGINGAFES